MKLIVGLGNQGESYGANRHNIGFVVVNKLAKKLSHEELTKSSKLEAETLKIRNILLLAKPLSFMNSSGVAVKKLRDYYKIKTDDLWIVHDDLDIKLGEYKINQGKGPKEHKGLLSVYDKLGSKDFWHVRVGVENRSRDNRISGEEYVLKDFKKEEQKKIDQVIDKIISDLIERLK